ncbi:UDP-N-acetylmuramoyl-L-alanyl-D-glutamate--2,6-diaminopimelate ligase [Gammaproteobacteria bacterium]|nr:UDP-N-acetylmuramoyl-L-alanyl-D-glutamate--2,6-diaminopimelate ligase [Gammaproteobacteria bacterium]
MHKSYLACLEVCQIDLEQSNQQLNVQISGLKDHADEVTSGDLFIAIAKDYQHQQRHIKQALQQGASRVFCSHKNLSSNIDCEKVLYVPYLKKYQVPLAQYIYDLPFAELQVVAVTGTSGKTSVCFMVAKALESIGKKAGYIGSLGYGDIDHLKTTLLTTPSVIQLHRMAYEIQQMGKKYLTVEASAHGLVQGRLAGIMPQVAVVTSLGHDHLDYFASLAEYHQSKVSQLIALGPRQIIMNAGDKAINAFIRKKELPDCFQVSMNHEIKAELTGSVFHSSLVHQQLKGKLGNQHFEVKTKLLGQAHALNTLISLGVLHQLGIDLPVAVNGLSQIKSIPGRVEKIVGKNGLCVILDMAHTPGALKNLCQIIENREPGSKVHCVFGCGGDRDTQKRPMMGQIAETFCSHIILTNDNPRTEDPKQIIKDIQSGMICTDHVEVVYDRQAAICRAIEVANDDDIVLVCGRGDEQYQMIGHDAMPLSDQKIIHQALGLSC